MAARMEGRDFGIVMWLVASCVAGDSTGRRRGALGLRSFWAQLAVALGGSSAERLFRTIGVVSPQRLDVAGPPGLPAASRQPSRLLPCPRPVEAPVTPRL
jgi:hypothetical protein